MISIVIPVFNEEESLPHLCRELISVLHLYKEHELIFIDDGSTDQSLEILKKLSRKHKSVKIFSFRKNLGKAEALTLGFLKAKGDQVVTIDADLQDKPKEVINVLNKLKRGYDLVSGWRKERKDSVKKVVSSHLFNFVVKLFWRLNLHDYNCGLKAYTKDCAKSLHLYGGLHRFIPLLAYQQGFQVAEVEVVHGERKFGKSKYGFSKLWRDLPDIFTMLFLSRYADRPLHFFGWFGGLIFFAGAAILVYLALVKLAGQGIGNRPILFLGMLLVISGLQVLFTGILADLIINLSKQQNKVFPIKYASRED